MSKILQGRGAYMNNNKVVNISNLSRRPANKEVDAEAASLLGKFKRLSSKEKETIMILIDAFLLEKGG